MTASATLSLPRRGTENSSKLSAFRFIAAPFTPKDREGNILPERIAEMADYLLSRGVAGVFIAGTTGEGMSLTLDERMELLRQWKQACGELELIVHVGHNCIEDAMVLARHAESLKVDAIAAIGPCFYPIADPDLLARYCQCIADAAPKTRFYYYHMPSMARVACKASEAFVALQKAIPMFAGIKFTHDDMEDYRRCLALAGNQYEIPFGRDELFLEALTAGTMSAVGSTYNFAAPLNHKIVAAFAAADEEKARSIQELASAAIKIMANAGGLAGIHATMKLAGFDCGAMRLPLQSLSEAQSEDLRIGLERLGYFDALRA